MKPVIKIVLTATLTLLALCGAASAQGVSWYAAPRYQLPVTPETNNWRSWDFETGIVIHDKWFIGVDVGHGTNKYSDSHGANIGFGFNGGYIWDLPHGLKFSAAGSLVLWLAESAYDRGMDIESVLDDKWSRTWGVMGASVRLRWRMFELSYRLILGDRESVSYLNDDPINYNYKGELVGKPDGTGYINQLMIGLYFGRWR